MWPRRVFRLLWDIRVLPESRLNSVDGDRIAFSVSEHAERLFTTLKHLEWAIVGSLKWPAGSIVPDVHERGGVQ